MFDAGLYEYVLMAMTPHTEKIKKACKESVQIKHTDDIGVIRHIRSNIKVP